MRQLSRAVTGDPPHIGAPFYDSPRPTIRLGGIMAVAIGVILAALNLIQLMLHAPCNRELADSRPPARYASH
jgi:hypothetical protein